MIKTKLTALISTLSLASVICVATAVSANAANVELNYNADLSSATEKVIDVDYEVDAALVSFGGSFEAKAEGAAISAYECLVNYAATLTKNGAKAGLDWSDLDFNGDVAASGTHGRLTITVPEGTGAFDVTFSGIATLDMDFNSVDDYAPVTITVPAWASAPVEPEKDAFTPVTALEGNVYDADKTTVPVKVWSTEIDYSTTKVEGTLVWAVKNAEGKVATVDATTVSGDATVVYGLAIAGQAAELETIESVELTVE